MIMIMAKNRRHVLIFLWACLVFELDFEKLIEQMGMKLSFLPNKT